MTSPDSCPVVRIATPITKGNASGFVEINVSDFNAEVHKLWDGTVAVVEKVEKAVVTGVEKLVETLTPGAPLNEAAKEKLGWGQAPPSA